MAFLRKNDIVPVTSPSSTKKVEPCHFFLADFDPGLVFVFIKLAFDVQPGLRFRGRDQIHDDLKCLKRSPSPVPADLSEETVFDLIPFGRTGRVMEDMHFKLKFGGEFLEFPLEGSSSKPPSLNDGGSRFV